MPKDRLGDEVAVADLKIQTAERKNDIPPEKWDILQIIFAVRELQEKYNRGEIGNLHHAPSVLAFANMLTDADTVVNVPDLSKTTRISQGESEKDVADEDPVTDQAQGAPAESDEPDNAEPITLTPASSTMPSPVDQQRSQGHNTITNSASSSFSEHGCDVMHNPQPVRQQTRPHNDALQRSMAGESIGRSVTSNMTYNNHACNQPAYSQMQMSHPQYQQHSMHPPMEHHETPPWSEYDDANVFNHISHMGAPAQSEPPMADYSMYNIAHMGSMATISHGLPCPEEFYQPQVRLDQMQRRLHHQHDFVAELPSQPSRDIPYRGTSTPSTQQMAMSRHNSYDQAMLQNSFYHHNM